MGLKGSKAPYRISTAAAGFVAGFAVTVMLFTAHQKHSEAHLEASSRLFPGQLPGQDGSAQASGQQPASIQRLASWLHLARRAPPAPPLPPRLRPPDLNHTARLMVGFGNSAYFDFVQNWARSVMPFERSFLIAALDDQMLGQCEAQGLPCVAAHAGTAAGDFRDNVAAFRQMGAIKIQFVLGLLEQHPTLELVVVSDSDCVWLRPPWQYLEQRQGVDFFVSTDCLSAKAEDAWQPTDRSYPLCGHVPGNSHAAAFNTGMFAVSNTPASRAFLKAWIKMLTDPAQAKHEDSDSHVDDQLALNLLFERGGLVPAGQEFPRAILAFDRSLLVQPLPVVLFSGGHVAFVQRTPWKRGVTPIAVHATFQRHPVAALKKHRLREFGLWHVDPPEYYGRVPPGLEGPAAGRLASTGDFPLKALAYGGEGEVLAFVEGQERARYGPSGTGHGMPLMEKHWLGMSYQLAAFRDSLAAARMLNRTLLLPTLWCWCDLSESPDVLEACRTQGSDVELPFECPLDFLLPADSLEAAGVDYRHPGFLALPQVPDTLRRAKAAVVIVSERPATPFPQPSHTVGHAVTVWAGIRQGELVQAVAPVEGEAVLQLRGAVPGFLGGFDDVAAAAAFDQAFDRAVDDYGEPPHWCCLSWGSTDVGERRIIRYQMPAPLADGWKPWEAPRLAVPPWCDLLSSEDGNDQWARLPQHPCAFLRNATAAALAAARPPPPPPPLAALAAEAGGGGEGAAGYQRGGFAGQDGSGGGVGEARGEQAAEEGAAEAGVGVEAGDAGGGRQPC